MTPHQTQCDEGLLALIALRFSNILRLAIVSETVESRFAASWAIAESRTTDASESNNFARQTSQPRPSADGLVS
jgi:hypothetical protein